MITKFGKRFLTDILSGNASNVNKDMAIGIGRSAASENNTRLDFEFYRLPVLFGTSNIQTSEGASTYSVVYKATIPQDVAGIINEVGLYPSVKSSINNYDSKFLNDFDSYLDWIDEDGFKVDFSTENVAIGTNILIMQSNNGASNEYFYNTQPIDISGYGPKDTISLAYYQYDTNLSDIKIRLYSSDTSYFESNVYVDDSTGHKISNDIEMSSFFNGANNAPDKTNIVKIGITLIPKENMIAVVGMDGLRVNDEDTFSASYGLISRSIITHSIASTGNIDENTITVASSRDLFVGQIVSGTGIASLTSITSINDNEISLSNDNLSNIDGSLVFYGLKKNAGKTLDLEFKINLGWTA